MNDLLDHAISAHGGRERWARIDGLQAEVTLHGPFWAVRGFSDRPFEETVTIDTRRELVRFSPWGESRRDFVFSAEDDVVELRAAADDRVLESRTGIRSTYRGYGPASPWKPLQVGYFIGYAMWNYLTTPFLLDRPEVVSHEGAEWTENGEVWRRLHVEFAPAIATHTARQTFYFGNDGLLRRLDYEVDVNAGAVVAHYVSDYRTFEGIRIPTRRRVHRRNADNSAGENWSIGIDIHRVVAVGQHPAR
ncbi:MULTISPECIES: hypothetical protein [unclassified Streptomyces]|uniref:hypothetical protein n=1 Tax=unclassified Streptomyces TaxID=2593676 RepID=UPI00367BAC2E